MQHQATVIGMTDDRAELDIGRGKKAILPKELLPKAVQVGDEVVLELLGQSQFHARQKNIAKAILNEILGGPDEEVAQEQAD
jgi:hypothetical protein